MLGRVKSFCELLKEVTRLLWLDADEFVKRRLLGVMMLVVAAAVLTALGPVALKLVVDNLVLPRKGSLGLPVLFIGMYAISQWLVRSAQEVRGFVYARAERRMFRALSERLFSHLMRLPLRFHLDRKTGAISQILDNGLQGYQLTLHHTVFTFLPVTVQLGTIVFILSRMNHSIFLAIFCGALLSYSIAFSFAAFATALAAERAADAHVEANATITDSILNYEAIKYFTAESLVQDRVSCALSRTEEAWISFYRRYALNGLVVSTIFATFLAAATLFAAEEVNAGRMTLGDFVLVNSYMLQVMQPVEMFGYAVQGISQGVAMLGKALSILRESPEQHSVTDSSCRSDTRASNLRASDYSLQSPGSLIFENVGLGYRIDRPVIDDVSFEIPSGKTLGIVGASGSGKSTLVRLLVRLVEPDCGQIRLNGKPIAEFTLSELRRSIAVVPQDMPLFNDTIAYNIAFGRAGCSQWEVEAAAKIAHLHDFIIELPDGYDTLVGERGLRMSGGERQRIAIARAAIKAPQIYVFDEATSSLDSQTEASILRSLQDIARSSTTIVIAHRLSTVVHADEILVLERGRVFERGTHADMLRKHGKYTALWLAQERNSPVSV